jgi:PIN domain nuclease of toxin-antitoxin system
LKFLRSTAPLVVGAAAKLAEHSQVPVAALAAIKQVVDGSLHVEPFTEKDAAEAADLRPRSREQGLSFGDRACLALAARFEVPAVTADRSWKDLPEIGVAVRLIR